MINCQVHTDQPCKNEAVVLIRDVVCKHIEVRFFWVCKMHRVNNFTDNHYYEVDRI